jgi:hypothetical protein
MGESYFESLEPERLVEVAKNLYKLAVEQLEKANLPEQFAPPFIRPSLSTTQSKSRRNPLKRTP